MRLWPMLGRMASISCFGSSPARAPMAIPSHAPMKLMNIMKLFTSLVATPLPVSPMRTTVLPRPRKRGSYRSNTACPPPTNTVRVASLAPKTPPLMGASSTSIPPFGAFPGDPPDESRFAGAGVDVGRTAGEPFEHAAADEDHLLHRGGSGQRGDDRFGARGRLSGRREPRKPRRPAGSRPYPRTGRVPAGRGRPAGGWRPWDCPCCPAR